MPDVSIIMPCHNGAAHAARGVSSVLDQRFGSLELIFVDDGSTDGSADLAQSVSDGRVRIIRKEHGGVSAARNLGLAHARGSLVAFLDVDDTWHPAFLVTMVGALRERPECALAYCGWRNVGVAGGRGEPYVPTVFDGLAAPERLLVSCPWPIHAALTRTDVLRKTRLFEPTLSVAEDFLLWLEIACFHPIVRVPQVLAYYDHHGGVQASRSSLRSAMQFLAAQQIFFERHPSVRARLGRRKVRELTLGTLLRTGYESYWRGDLEAARKIFRRVMRAGYGAPRDWRHMLPSLLPSALHREVLGMFRALRS